MIPPNFYAGTAAVKDWHVEVLISVHENARCLGGEAMLAPRCQLALALPQDVPTLVPHPWHRISPGRRALFKPAPVMLTQPLVLPFL